MSDFLIARAHWLMWRRELIWLQKTGEWKWTKVPFQHNRKPGSSTDRKTWSDWETIQVAFDRDAEGDKFFDGIGFALTPDLGLIGFDLDHCYDPLSGYIDPTVAHFLRILSSYTEITPGGDGFRVFTFGILPTQGRKRANFPQPGLACECYSEGRYLTVTGHRLGDATEIIANQAGIDKVHHAIFGEMLAKREAAKARVHSNDNGAAHLNLSDQQLLDTARHAANGARFAALYDRGDWSGAGYPSASEADAALCNQLAFYAGADHGRIDSLFRTSGLMRDKWNREDYRDSTITKALEGRRQFYANGASGRSWDDVRDDIGSDGNGASSPPLPDNNPTTSSRLPAQRPRIAIVEGGIPGMIDAAEQALLPRCEDLRLFQSTNEVAQVGALEKADSSGGLVRPAGTVQLIPMTALKLLEIFDREIEWVRLIGKKQEPRPVDSKLAYSQRYLSRRGEWKLPHLRGVIEAPTLRPDGSLFEQPGYDSATELFLAASVEWKIPQEPSRDDALAALQVLRAPFREFPWIDPVDEAVHLSAILTAFQRRLLFSAPLHAYDAHAPGSGKSLLAQCVGLIVTGRSPTAMPVADDEAEVRKSVTASLREGHVIILLDNLARPLQSPDLARALTEPYYGDRLLGTNTTIRAATNVLWLATMNNFCVIGDLVRRVLVSRIDAKTERPEERIFEIKDLRQHLLDNRKALVIAVLTILRAYHVAGCPRQENLKIFGGFEQWSREIREPLVWLNLPDPCGSREFVLEGDSDRDNLGAVLAAWHDVFATGEYTVSEVITKINNEFALTALRDALLLVAADYHQHDCIDPRRLGAWLRDQGKTVDGLRFERGGKSHRAIRWKVAVIESAKLDEASS